MCVFGVVILSMLLVGQMNADPFMTLTVNSNSDTPMSYPGGQRDLSSATAGDLRYCLN